MAKKNGELSATGYLLSQEDLIRGLEVVPAEFSYAQYRTYQVPIRRVEDLTVLSFGLSGADPLERRESTPSSAEIDRLEQLVL